MAKTDWDQSGSGSAAVVSDGGSMRLQIAGSKLLLWNDRNDLVNTQVVADYKPYGSGTNYRGGLILRCDGTLNNCYRLNVYGPRTYYIQKIVDGVVTNLVSIPSSQPQNIYVKTRFTIDGWQLSVEEYIDGQWILLCSVDDFSQARPNGYCGVEGNSVSSSYVVYLDNVEIRELV